MLRKFYTKCNTHDFVGCSQNRNSCRVAAPVQGRADFNPERRRRIRTRICICVRGHHRWPKISG